MNFFSKAVFLGTFLLGFSPLAQSMDSLSLKESHWSEAREFFYHFKELPQDVLHHIASFLIGNLLNNNFEIAKYLGGHEQQVCSGAFSPDDELIFTCSMNTKTRLWSTAQGQQLKEITCPASGGLTSGTMSPDGKKIVVGAYDKKAYLANIDSEGEPISLSGHTHIIASVAWSPDGKKIATSSPDSTIRLWDSELAQEFAIFYACKNEDKNPKLTGVFSVAFSSDGTMIIAGLANGETVIWNIASKEELYHFKNHNKKICSVAFTHDNKLVLTSSSEGTACLYNLASKKIVQRIGEQCELDHEELFPAQLSSDGHTIITGFYDGTVCLWDVQSGKKFLELPGHKKSNSIYWNNNAIRSVAYNHQGNKILSCSRDKTACLYEIVSSDASRWISDNLNLDLAFFIIIASHIMRAGGSFTISAKSSEGKLFALFPVVVKNYLKKWYSVEIEDLSS